jgi:hypothetical protein
MLELTMASGRPDLSPPIMLDQPDHLSNLQERARFYAPDATALKPRRKNGIRGMDYAFYRGRRALTAATKKES